MSVSAQTVAASLRLRARVVPTGQRMPWLEARKAVADKGGLPSQPLLDDCLVRSYDWQAIQRSLPLWSSQILVHPAVGGVFKKEVSITDSASNLVFPAEHIPEAAFDKSKTGLLVLPDELRETANGLVIGQPISVLVVHGLVEQNGAPGKLDEATRLPLELARGETYRPESDKIRFLFRKDGPGVGPLVRGAWRVVGADDRHDCAFGVASVAYDILDGANELARGVSLADMRRFAAEATGSDLPEALRALGSEQLEAIRRLTRAHQY